jgi:hypothetical protein
MESRPPSRTPGILGCLSLSRRLWRREDVAEVFQEWDKCRFDKPSSQRALAVFPLFASEHRGDEPAFCFGPLMGKKLTIVS